MGAKFDNIVEEDKPLKYEEISFKPKERNIIVNRLQETVKMGHRISRHFSNSPERGPDDGTTEYTNNYLYEKKQDIKGNNKNLREMRKTLDSQKYYYNKNKRILMKVTNVDERNIINNNLKSMKQSIDDQEKEIKAEEIKQKNRYMEIVTLRKNQNRDVTTGSNSNVDTSDSVGYDTEYVSAKETIRPNINDGLAEISIQSSDPATNTADNRISRNNNRQIAISNINQGNTQYLPDNCYSAQRIIVTGNQTVYISRPTS